jgi:hypothetical protein
MSRVHEYHWPPYTSTANVHVGCHATKNPRIWGLIDGLLSCYVLQSKVTIIEKCDLVKMILFVQSAINQEQIELKVEMSGRSDSSERIDQIKHSGI